MRDLFGRDDDPPAGSPASATRHAPLAERMRPRSLDEIVGQEELLGPGAPLRRAIERDQVASMILWGPPGSGKTTLARLIAHLTRSRFVSFSAVLSGIREIKDIMAEAQRSAAAGGARTFLFVDEIHRFNRAQQDAFLPHVERGTIVLIGATTENPSFSVNAALLSRCSVHVLAPLSDDALRVLLRRALEDARGLGAEHLVVADEDLRLVAGRSAGDARRALNALETVALACGEGPARRPITRADLERALQRAALLYDKSGEEHFNLISALHKSLRNSDADAALYWLVRMIESGEDPLYVARRMIRFASEDVGNADPRALRVALDARDAFESLGLPEGALALAQAALYLAAAPKSNSVTLAYDRVLEDLKQGLTDPVPLALRNAPTGLMKNLGYGRDYRYAHDEAAGTADLECLPPRLSGRRYYEAKPVGDETALAERLRRASEARERLRADAASRSKESAPPARTVTPAPPRRTPGRDAT
jgi:putative ATPase